MLYRPYNFDELEGWQIFWFLSAQTQELRKTPSGVGLSKHGKKKIQFT